jgi:hypothetical protein
MDRVGLGHRLAALLAEAETAAPAALIGIERLTTARAGALALSSLGKRSARPNRATFPAVPIDVYPRIAAAIAAGDGV